MSPTLAITIALATALSSGGGGEPKAAVAAVISSKAWPAGGNKQQQRGQVAVVDIGKVLSSYDGSALPDEELAPLLARREKLYKEIADHEHVLQGADRRRTEELNRAIQDRRRGLEATEAELRKVHGELSKRKLADQWKQIAAAAQSFAKSQGFTLVLGYAEPREETDRLSFDNVNRKMLGMDQGGLVPVYIDPICDITDELIAELHRGHKQPKRELAPTK